MSDVKLMTGVKYSPSGRQHQARWSAARSKKLVLLRSSDWTQLRDVYNQLTPQQRLAWDSWRRQVRAIKAANFSSPEEFEAALASISAKLPAPPDPSQPVEPVADGVYEEQPVSAMQPEDGTSIRAEDAIHEMIHLATQTINRKCGVVNALTQTERLSQAYDAYVDVQQHGEAHAALSREYPIISLIADLTEQPIGDVAASTIKRYQKWIAVIAVLEALGERALDRVDNDDASTEANSQIITWLDSQIVELIEQFDTIAVDPKD